MGEVHAVCQAGGAGGVEVVVVAVGLVERTETGARPSVVAAARTATTATAIPRARAAILH
jgi:hypothetical protein